MQCKMYFKFFGVISPFFFISSLQENVKHVYLARDDVERNR